MTKPQKSSLLKKAIATSGIYKSINILKAGFQNYEQWEEFSEQRYIVKQEFDKVRKVFQELGQQLEELENDSQKWEAPE